MEGGVHIALKAEEVWSLLGVPITNTMLMSWIVMLTLIGTAFFVGKRIKKIPSKTQTFFETLFSFLLNYLEEVLESRVLAKRFFPLLATFFMFILLGNWFGLIPGIGSLYIKHPHESVAASHHEKNDTEHQDVSIVHNDSVNEVSHIESDEVSHVSAHEEVSEGVSGEVVSVHHIPLLHPVSVDLNFTLALALIAFFTIEISGVVYVGALRYASKFINLRSPIGFWVGIIELISEMARIISFSFRLFGNMFAGKTLILVAMFFAPFIAPVPLMLYEVFVGFVQASIFTLLTLFFVKLAISEAH